MKVTVLLFCINNMQTTSVKIRKNIEQFKKSSGSQAKLYLFFICICKYVRCTYNKIIMLFALKLDKTLGFDFMFNLINKEKTFLSFDLEL